MLQRGIQAIVILLVPATAAMIVLGLPAARLIVFGESAAAAEPLSWAMAAFAPGLAAYGIFLLLARGAYAHGDARLPALTHLLVTAIGVAGMVVATAVAHGEARIAGLAGAHSVAYLLGTVVLGVALARRRAAAIAESGAVGAGEGDMAPRPAVRLVHPAALTRAFAAGGIVAAIMAAARLLELGGERTTALLQLAVGGAAGLAMYLALLRILGLGDPRRLLHPETMPHA